MQRGRGDIKVKVVAETDKSSVARTKAETESLGGEERVEVKVDFDKSKVDQATRSFRSLKREGSGLDAVFNRSSLSIGQQIQVMAAALPVIADLAGALGALSASAAAAGAGLGALAVGAGGAATVGFGGILSIAGPAIGKLNDLRTAQEAAHKAQITGAGAAGRASAASAQQIQAAQDQVADATEGVADAEQQLETAQESATVAQEALTQARRDAVRELQDMRRASIEGETSEKRARLSLQQAIEELNRIRGSSQADSFDIRDAELSVVEARQNLRDVTIDSHRAQNDFNRAQKKGIDEMPGVVSAQQGLDDAVRSVSDAQEGVADAHRDVARALQNLSIQQKEANTATAAGATQMAALELAQRKAGPAAVKFAGNLKELGQRWRRLTMEGRNDFFAGLDDGLTRVNKKLPLLARSANTSMHALRQGMDQFLDRATGPEFDKFINVMTRTFANSIGPISRAFGNIAIVLERLAVAVAPDIVRMMKGFEDVTEGWLDSTRNAEDLRDTVHELVNQTNAWRKLLDAAVELIVAVLVPGMGQGKLAVQGMTEQLREWTKWVNQHPDEVRNFMREGLKTTKELARALLAFLPILVEIGEATRPIARLFLQALKALNSIKVPIPLIGDVHALTLLFGVLVSTRLFRSFQLMKATLALMASGKVATALKGFVGLTAVGTGVGAAGAAGAAGGAGGAGGTLARQAPKWLETALGGAAGGAGTTSVGRLLLKRLGPPAAAATAVDHWWGQVADVMEEVPILGDLGGFPGEKVKADLSKGMEELQSSIEDVGSRPTRRQLKGLHGQAQQMIADFKEAGQEIPPELRKVAGSISSAFGRSDEQLGRWRSSLTELRQMIFRNLGDIRDKTREALQRINRIQGISNRRREELVVKSYEAQVRTIEKSMKAGLIAHKKGLREIQKIRLKILGALGVEHPRIVVKLDAGAAFRARHTDTMPFERGHHRGGIITQTGVIPLQGFQGGGVVGSRGLKPGPRDKIPALLEVGELVIPKELVDKTRKNAKATSVAMSGEIGKGYKKVREGTDALVDHHGKSIKEFRKDTEDGFHKTTKDAIDQTGKLKEKVTEGFNKTRAQTLDSTGQMKKGVGEDFREMTGAVRDGIGLIAEMTNRALKALGVDKISFGAKTEKPGGGSSRRQTGGMVVPGTGSGDSVPVNAMVEPGEVLAVLNRNAAKAWMAWNDNFPRFARGGMAGPFQNRGDVLGSGPGFIPFMNYLNSMFGPLNVISGLRPGSITTSGNPSNHGWGGAVDISTPGGEGATQSNPMTGALGRRMDATHAWIGKYFQPMLLDFLWRTLVGGNHYNHIHTGIDRAYSFNADKMSAYISRLPKGGGFEALKKVSLTGPDGPLKDMGQAALDKVHAAASRFLSRKSNTAGFGTGKAPDAGGTFDKAELMQLWKSAGSGGSAGLMAAIALAESSGNPNAVNPIGGGDPTGLWQIRPTPVHPVSQKALLDPLTNAQWAHRILDSEGLQAWEVYTTGAFQRYMKRGGMVPPFIGSFKDGGTVPNTGLGLLHQGEEVIPHGRGRRAEFTITNWRDGSGWMREIASDEVEGNDALAGQHRRMR